MAKFSRRDFLRTSAGAMLVGGVAGRLPAYAAKRSATDMVTLGHSGIQVTRLAFGTGTYGGRVQRELGQEGFTRLVRYAYDRGIRFFETADTYGSMHAMLGTALKGLPRDSYQLMTKYNPRKLDDPTGTIDAYRKELNTEYFDILLLHCVRTPGWNDELAKLRDAFSEAKAKQAIRAHGASVHGLPALGAFPGNRWLDVAMIRMNHNGTRMDTNDQRDVDAPGDVPQVVANVKKMQQQGAGVISMKLIGEGRFTRAEDRQAALDYAFQTARVDAVTIGFKSNAEIDEAIERMGRSLNA